MASLIVCTPGGASDNCYVTTAQAAAHFANTLREETWDAYPTTTLERALIQATQEIEALGGERIRADLTSRVRFIGRAYDDDASAQALHFPRTVDYDTAVLIPTAVKAAVCEQAWWLLQQRDTGGPLVDTDDLRARGVTNSSVDGVSVSLGPTSVPRGIAPKAWDHIRQFVRQAWPTSARHTSAGLTVRGGYRVP